MKPLPVNERAICPSSSFYQVRRCGLAMSKLLKLARLQFLVAGLALFLFGALVAVLVGAPFEGIRLLLGCLIVLSAQLAVNFGNDYFDTKSDQLDGGTLISGGSGVLLQHPELRVSVRWIVTSLIVFSLIMGLVFHQVYSYPFWMFGFVILGNLFGWMYSAPPFRLAERGLGEVCFTVVIGFLLPMTGYLTLRGAFDSAGALLLIPLIFYALVFILSVEIPDLEGDRLGNKKTWIVRTGRRLGFTMIGLSLIAATGYFFILPQLYPLPFSMDFRAAGTLSLMPLLPGLWGLVRRPVERQLATRIATWIVVTLSLFAVLMDVYLFLLIK
jgi:1,4-dihydroxy-2-naphthoate octaprenyltransferase